MERGGEGGWKGIRWDNATNCNTVCKSQNNSFECSVGVLVMCMVL